MRYLVAFDWNSTLLDDVQAHQETIPLNRNAESVLCALRQQDIHCAVLSNEEQGKLACDVGNAGISDYFTIISGNRNILERSFMRTKEKRLRNMAQKLDVPMSNVAVVDDYCLDINGVGGITIAITGGVMSRKRLEACNPDFIIDHLGGVKPVLQHKWGLGS